MAWNYLLNATILNPSLLDIPTFHNDMVDVTRQVFANTFITLYNELLGAWNTSNITTTQTTGITLIDLLTDLDTVLATDETFILGKWIGDAIRWSTSNDTYSSFLEYNARNQVSPRITPALMVDNALGSDWTNQRLRV
jgi:alpha-N-acetylglucosaminidase